MLSVCPPPCLESRGTHGPAVPAASETPRAVADLTGCILPFYRWISSHDVLLFEGEMEKLRLSGLSIVRLEGAPNGLRRTPLPGFREMWATLKREDSAKDQFIPAAAPSPDGRRILFQNFPSGPGSGMVSWKVKNLRDRAWSPSVTPFLFKLSDPVWSPDGTLFLLVTDRGIQYYDPKRSETRPHRTAPLPEKVADVAGEPGRGSRSLHHGWVASSGKLFFLSDPRREAAPTPDDHGWKLLECQSFDDPKSVRWIRIRPPGERVAAVELSPDGKRLAWLVVKYSRTADLWLTDLDGTDARLLVSGIEPPRVVFPSGEVTEVTEEGNPPRTLIRGMVEFRPDSIQLAWRPGSTEISYNSEGKLWVVATRSK
jgi:hypothetical protein